MFTPIYLQVNALIVRELSGFTCTSSLTINKKLQFRTRLPRAAMKGADLLTVPLGIYLRQGACSGQGAYISIEKQPNVQTNLTEFLL